MLAACNMEKCKRFVTPFYAKKQKKDDIKALK